MVTNGKREMLNRWRLNCRRSQIANYNCANRFTRQNYWLGIPTVILSAVVGTAVFANLEKDIDPYNQIMVGLLSVFAAILAALQTFLKRESLASKHRSVAAEYGSMKRQLDQEIVKLEADEEVLQETVDRIREGMDRLSREGPVVPSDIWAKARVTTPTAE